ncbi:MAG TPA: type VI secretion protein IcmF/TssM N-terminal domain-containing protein [Verrucomicrobiae bacterium]|nr:type VI secretion protein IcmF/TssM N-terminal domain-containing protein [Verrucomicrobiae bacterium]
MKQWLARIKDRFNELPTLIRWFIGLITGAVLYLAALAYSHLRWWFLLCVVALSLAVVAIFVLGAAAIRRRKSRRVRDGIMAINLPLGVAPAAAAAELAKVKLKFQKGIDEYRRRGTDLYVVPWYLIVGDSGAGKTQVIRHSDLNFPPGMQDYFQGVGGTIGMDWWFTTHAVILDTAGDLIFEQVKPGETSAWREFLALLRLHRPRCPVNGLLVAIPADSLVKDPLYEPGSSAGPVDPAHASGKPKSVTGKAQHLARQLQLIQRELDVCLPVFVVVTKSDLIGGYREFFQHLQDPSQHQILGWSNPEPIEQAVETKGADDAELHQQKLQRQVQEGISQVVHQLRQHRLGMLRNPEATNPQGRRTDDVDSFYAFPRNLLKLEEPLWIYLRHLFARGPFFRPLFFRGIYFNSSMQEGAALDQQLAGALGLPVDKLVGGFRQERPFFLRDFFREKVFREWGLVVRATNTLRLLRLWQMAFICCAFVAPLIWLLLVGFGKRSIETGVGQERDYWDQAGKGWTKFLTPGFVPPLNEPRPAYLTNPIVWRTIVDGNGSYQGESYTLSSPTGSVSLVEFHAGLRRLAEDPPKADWVFRPLESKPTRDRRSVQRIIFEASVIKPLLLLVRQRILKRSPGPMDEKELHQHLEALQSLLRMEGGNVELTASEASGNYLQPWFDFVAGGDPSENALSSLAATMARTYSGAWPPRSLSEGTSSLSNSAVLVGLTQLANELSRFPLGLPAGSNSLDADQVLDASRSLGALDKTLASSESLPKPVADSVRQLRTQLAAAARMAAPLVTSNGQVGSCQITILTNKDPILNWRGYELMRAGKRESNYFSHTNLSTVKLDEPFRLSFVSNPADPRPSVSPIMTGTNDWTVLRWLHETKASRQTDGTNWIITVPFPSPFNSKTVQFNLKFHTAVPELVSWPTKTPSPR